MNDTVPALREAVETGAARERAGYRDRGAGSRSERAERGSRKGAAPDVAWDDPADAVSARSRRHLEQIASILGLPVAFFFSDDRREPEPAGLSPETVSRVIDLVLEFAECGSEDKRDALVRYIESVGGKTFDP